MGENGWTFDAGPSVIPDPIGRSAAHFYEAYLRLRTPPGTGLVTVPVLWDNERDVIVSNESSEIIRIMKPSLSTTLAQLLGIST